VAAVAGRALAGDRGGPGPGGRLPAHHPAAEQLARHVRGCSRGPRDPVAGRSRNDIQAGRGYTYRAGAARSAMRATPCCAPPGRGKPGALLSGAPDRRRRSGHEPADDARQTSRGTFRGY
jgi:hypothetical protein